MPLPLTPRSRYRFDKAEVKCGGAYVGGAISAMCSLKNYANLIIYICNILYLLQIAIVRIALIILQLQQKK